VEAFRQEFRRQFGRLPSAAEPLADEGFQPIRRVLRQTDWSTLKPLCGQERMFSTTSGSIFSSAK
jgi:hypothetical protein